MREVELKAVVDDLRACRQRVEAAGGTLSFAGRLEDRRYDSAERTLAAGDFVLRLRTYRNAQGVSASIDWKGPTQCIDEFKVRDEITSEVSDPAVLDTILTALGYTITREIDRDIVQYDLGGTMIRFERYPRMDTLVEVEGEPEGIEAAIKVLELPREQFTTLRLADFIRSYEARTGQRAAVCDRELAGDYRYRVRDAS